MSKTLDTKIKILKILNKKSRTVTQISEVLGLAQSTVSQHIDELKASGVIMEFDDSNNRKWKYYKVNKNNYNKLMDEQKSAQKEYLLAKKIIAVLIVIGILSILVIAYQRPKNNAYNITTNYTNANSINKNNTVITPIATAVACPIIFANKTFNTTLIGYNGMSYYNDSIAQFILQRGNSGIIYLNISKLQSSSNITINNFAEFVYSENYNTTNIQNHINVVINETNGVIINFNRSSENLTNFVTSERLKVTINAESNATQGTYRVILPEGSCRPNEMYMLLTIGNKPYNGTIEPVAIPYG